MLLLVGVSGCERGKAGSGPAPSASSGASSGELVTPSNPPGYSLDGLDEMKLAALLSKDGWKTTTVGRAPAGANERAYRAVGIKTFDGKQHEAEVLLRCPPKGGAPEGSAYFDQGSCRTQVLVRIGIVVQPEKSKSLLERLLATRL
jgi:hypothetical protein